MLAVGALGRTKVHRDAVLHHFVLFQDLIENAQRASAVNHEIFGYDFKPVHDGLAREDVVVMRGAQSDPDAVLGKIVKCVGWHRRSLYSNREGPATLAGTSELPLGEQHPLQITLERNCPVEVWTRRLRSRLCHCKSSCLCSRCRSPSSTLALAGVLTLASVLFLHLVLVLRLVLRCD